MIAFRFKPCIKMSMDAAGAARTVAFADTGFHESLYAIRRYKNIGFYLFTQEGQGKVSEDLHQTEIIDMMMMIV